MGRHKQVLIGVVLVILALSAGALCTRQINKRQNFRQVSYTTTFEVFYVWDRGLRGFDVKDHSKSIVVSDPALNRLIHQEAERFVPALLANLHWQKANGSFTVRVLGAGEPHVVQLVELRTPSDPDFTPLMHAAEIGDYSVAARLLETNIEVDATDQSGRSALMLAAQHGQNEIVRALLKKGADPNREGPDRWTPLMFAVSSGNLDCVREVVRSGADVNERNAAGETPLDHAKGRNFQHIISFLESSGAS